MRMHSIHLLVEKCLGCTHCLKVCPVDAIRVRDQKARINERLCIDCGECVRICPYQAHQIVVDDFNMIYDSPYRILIVPPSFWGQFPDYSVEILLAALQQIGFMAVVSESVGYHLFLEQIHQFLVENQNTHRSFIIPDCPAVVRLIFSRFPSLIPNIIPIKNSLEITSCFADYYFRNTLAIRDFSIYCLSTCSAKVTAIKAPIGEKNSLIKGAFSIRDFYNRINSIEKKHLALSDDFVFLYNNPKTLPILPDFNLLNINGCPYVSDIFDKLENNQSYNLDVINPYYCEHGCENGILQVQNPFLAEIFLKRKVLPGHPLDIDLSEVPFNLYLSENLNRISFMDDSQGLLIKLQNLQKIEQLYSTLPHLDCGGCGSPSCYTFAEDVIRDHLDINRCVFRKNEGGDQA
ncbi:MAG: 4Fe-4S binding protein [Candidatus Delongbacteria bacterium]|nr:4Fe-4S binding protein [Candidatus Delongbacteria bacterium]